MRCEQITELLSPYMDLMTDERENQQVEAHLTSCPSCRQQLEHLQMLHSLLHKLDAPVLPEQFTEDFHRRLNQSKRRYLFAPSEIKRPQRQGWIAAAVAALALAVGIYTSSFLPAGSIASLWQDKSDNRKAPTVAVDDIIKRFQQWTQPDVEQAPQVADNTTKDTVAPPKTDSNTAVNPDVKDSNGSSSTQPTQETPVVEPKVADVYKAQIKVNDMASSVSKVVQIADSSGADSWVVPGTTVQAMSGSATREITIKTTPDQVQNILSGLQSVGISSASVSDQIEMTAEYTEAVTTIQAIDQEIAALQSKNAATDQTRIEDLKKQLQNWKEKKAQIERDAEMVTIRVTLVEQIKP